VPGRKAPLVTLCLLLVLACRREPEPGASFPNGPTPQMPATGPAPTPASSAEQGTASYYSDKLAGRRTASGERYDPRALTAAHRSLEFGTKVRVVRDDDGREVVVRINDRGPFGEGDRIIDLSRAAAERLGMMRAGVVAVRLQVLNAPDEIPPDTRR
jgi:peptidoglycan lytic transglycosylase